MSEQQNQPQTAPTSETPKPEPLKFDAPVYDYVQKSGDPTGVETRNASGGKD